MGYVKFVVETNLYRGLLLENINRERKNREREQKKKGVKEWAIKVPFYEIDNRENKTKRIYTLEPKVSNGWICFNRSLSIDFMNMIEDLRNRTAKTLSDEVVQEKTKSQEIYKEQALVLKIIQFLREESFHNHNTY